MTKPGATLYLLCFSDAGPETGPDSGPHPVSEAELRAAFNPATGWTIRTLEPDRIHTRFHGENGVPAWFATIQRN